MNYGASFLLLIAFLLLQSPMGVVTGRLLSKEGSPAAGVRVSAVASPDIIVASGLTDDSGRYRLDGISPGRYYITAGLVDLPSYYPGVTRASDAKLVSVTAGAVAANIDFVMAIPTDVRVSGRVIWPPGQDRGTIPLVVMVPSNPQLLTPLRTMLQTVIKADGTFEFPKVRPGAYRMMMPSSPAALSFEKQITVIDRDITGIEIALPVMVDVTGRVVVEGSRAPVPLFPLLFTSEGRSSSTFVSTDGTLRIQLPAGEYRTTVGPLPPGYQVKSYAAGETDLLRESLKLTAGIRHEIVVTLNMNTGNEGAK